MVKGISVNDTNELIITWIDIFKKKKVGIIVVDENGKLKNEINTLNQPCQIATIPMSENKGVLTFESRDGIQLIDFQNKTLLNYVSVNGKVIRSVKTISSSVKPKYIALDTTGHIYYSDNEAVYCMRKDGEYRFIYQPPENNILHGIAIDSYGYVYIIVDSQYVWRLGPDGKFVDIEVNDEGWETLKFICFNKDFPGHNRGIITSLRTDTIQFVDFNTCKLFNETSIEGCREGGVAASNENIFVGTKGNIKVLDHKGRHIRSIKMNNNELTPRYIVLDKIGNIYHSDSEVVCCTTIDGKNLFTYKPPDNNRLHGIAIDSLGYVYVVVQNQGVQRLRPDGTFSDLLANEHSNRSFEAICFNKDCTKLYISKGNGFFVYNRQ
ncbi:Hypothetical predicted protein [Mytilus galloprovincialis]|uniref:Uncharacterized protein n=1 Tax=Mytilus galloprovincialis TaxID=29158 RepID=A0A8B6DHN6_MYTGA|nr:Hypothetical predicted protein [Mytilus galloprovincialis]